MLILWRTNRRQLRKNVTGCLGFYFFNPLTRFGPSTNTRKRQRLSPEIFEKILGDESVLADSASNRKDSLNSSFIQKSFEPYSVEELIFMQLRRRFKWIKKEELGESEME